VTVWISVKRGTMVSVQPARSVFAARVEEVRKINQKNVFNISGLDFGFNLLVKERYVQK